MDEFSRQLSYAGETLREDRETTRRILREQEISGQHLEKAAASQRRRRNRMGTLLIGLVLANLLLAAVLGWLIVHFT